MGVYTETNPERLARKVREAERTVVNLAKLWSNAVSHAEDGIAQERNLIRAVVDLEKAESDLARAIEEKERSRAAQEEPKPPPAFKKRNNHPQAGTMHRVEAKKKKDKYASYNPVLGRRERKQERRISTTKSSWRRSLGAKRPPATGDGKFHSEWSNSQPRCHEKHSRDDRVRTASVAPVSPHPRGRGADGKSRLLAGEKAVRGVARGLPRAVAHLPGERRPDASHSLFPRRYARSTGTMGKSVPDMVRRSGHPLGNRDGGAQWAKLTITQRLLRLTRDAGHARLMTVRRTHHQAELVGQPLRHGRPRAMYRRSHPWHDQRVRARLARPFGTGLVRADALPGSNPGSCGATCGIYEPAAFSCRRAFRRGERCPQGAHSENASRSDEFSSPAHVPYQPGADDHEQADALSSPQTVFAAAMRDAITAALCFRRTS
jgi:hypothetical protein